MRQLTDEQIEEGYDNCTECGAVGNYNHHDPVGLCGGLDGIDDVFEDTDGTPLGRYNQIFKYDDLLCDNCLNVVAKRRTDENV
jgi:hypothetical protein